MTNNPVMNAYGETPYDDKLSSIKPSKFEKAINAANEIQQILNKYELKIEVADGEPVLKPV